jgi:hypothetical protein
MLKVYITVIVVGALEDVSSNSGPDTAGSRTAEVAIVEIRGLTESNRPPRGIVAAVSGFEENLNDAVNHFKLLRVALGEERINPLADVSWIFFPFQE